MNTNLSKKIDKPSLILGIVILVFIILVIFPLYKGVKKNSEDFVLQKKELANLKIKKENLEKFQKIYQDYQPNLAKIDQLFIEPEAPVNFISFLEKIAKDSQVSLKITPGETEEGPPSFTPFQLSLFSSFPNFLRFLEKLENSPYLIEITNLTLNRLTEMEISVRELKFSEGDVKGNLTIKVYTKEL